MTSDLKVSFCPQPEQTPSSPPAQPLSLILRINCRAVDNGFCYISGDLAKWLEDQKMNHVRGAPFHPQTQGKTPLIVFEKRLPGEGTLAPNHEGSCSVRKHYLPGALERLLEAFVDYEQNQRYHESLKNVTPANVYFDRNKAILRERKRIQNLTIRQRRLQHQKQAA